MATSATATSSSSKAWLLVKMVKLSWLPKVISEGLMEIETRENSLSKLNVVKVDRLLHRRTTLNLTLLCQVNFPMTLVKTALEATEYLALLSN